MDTKYSGTIKTRRKKALIKSQRWGIYAICAYYNRATTSKTATSRLAETYYRAPMISPDRVPIIFGHLNQAALLEKRVDVDRGVLHGGDADHKYELLNQLKNKSNCLGSSNLNRSVEQWP